MTVGVFMRRLVVVLLGALAFFGFVAPPAGAAPDPAGGLSSCLFGEDIGPVEAPVAVSVGLSVDCLTP
ncbi:hypothetical protein GCM10020221_12010 [Streptomyces thioluteus]|uniref:Secreted protein n=1 Tax=Streptomyces thioluteus TaxID=66431 RepID=A0ABN3WIQ8_STRTU